MSLQCSVVQCNAAQWVASVQSSAVQFSVIEMSEVKWSRVQSQFGMHRPGVITLRSKQHATSATFCWTSPQLCQTVLKWDTLCLSLPPTTQQKFELTSCQVDSFTRWLWDWVSYCETVRNDTLERWEYYTVRLWEYDTVQILDYDESRPWQYDNVRLWLYLTKGSNLKKKICFYFDIFKIALTPHPHCP